MNARLWTLLLVSTLGGCGFSLPNGVFSCVSPSDCPSGYFCWNSDSRCYDAEEPRVVCQPDTCEDVIADFAALGAVVECGTFPDGCDGVVECPPCEDGNVCGAGGQNFMCGCEPATCSSASAQCGEVAVGCGLDETINCGECLGQLVCGDDNQCVCPEGQNCDRGCEGGCPTGEVCVDGACCAPTFPCAENECSPPGGLPNGCGEMVDCGGCGAESCELQPDLRFACIDDCSCEANGIECGTVSLCGESRVCGVCDASAPICDDGACVCRDAFEPNDSPGGASKLQCKGACGVTSVLYEGKGTLDRPGDVDFYAIEVVHDSNRAIQVDVQGLRSTRTILSSYICPSGTDRIVDCSGSSGSVGGTQFCLEDGSNSLRLVQSCSGSGEPATVIIGIGSKDGEFKGPCDDYSFTISSFYFDNDD